MAQVPASAAEAERATNQPQSDPLPDGISEEDADAAVRALAVMGGLDLQSFRMPSLKRLREAIVPCAALLSDRSPWLDGSALALLWSDDEMGARTTIVDFLPLRTIGRVIPWLSKIFRDKQPVVLYRVARDVSPGVCEKALDEFLGQADRLIKDVFPDGPQEGKMKDAFDEVRRVGEFIEKPILHEAIGRFLDVVHFKGRDFRVFCGDDREAWGDAVREEITMIDDEGLRWIQITSPDHAGSLDRIRIRHDFSKDNLCPRRVEFTIKFHHAVDDEAYCGVIAGVSIDGLGKIVVKSDYYDDEIYYSMLWVANHQSLDQGFDIATVEPDTCYAVSIVVDWDIVKMGGEAPEATVTMTSIPSGEKTPGYDYDFECPRCEPMKHVEIFNQANAVTLISSFSLKYSERIERDAQFVIDPDSDEDDSDCS